MSRSISRVLAAAGLAVAATALPLAGTAVADDVYIGAPCYSSSGSAYGAHYDDDDDAGVVPYGRGGNGNGRGEGGRYDGGDGYGWYGHKNGGKQGGDGRRSGGHGGGYGNGYGGGYGNGYGRDDDGSGEWARTWDRGGPDCNTANLREVNDDDGILGNLF